MRKNIILLLCCGVLVSMVGCGGNTAPPYIESSSSIALEIIMTETSHTTTVEPTEKETVSIESRGQAIEPIITEPTTTVTSTEETTPSEATNESQENIASQVVETVTSTISQNTENETTVAELTKETVSEP